MADHARLRKPLLVAFLALGVGACFGLAFVGPGDWHWGVLLFVLGNVGLSGSVVFSDALLPHVAQPHEVDRLAASAFALGYLGGALLFALNILWIQFPAWFGLADAAAAMRLSFASAGAWWLLFALPLLWRVREPPGALEARAFDWRTLRAGLTRLAATFHDLRRFREAALFLAAFLVYGDGINTIVRLGTLYGTELGISTGALVWAVLLVQVVGVPCSLVFGALAARIGAQAAIQLALATYVAITLVGYTLHGPLGFFLLAGLIGMVQGGSQALSRSLFASLVPRHKAAEFFGFFGVFEKLGSVLGPALFAAALGSTGSSRQALLGLVVFFVAGAWLLSRVDVEAGRRAARLAEQEAAGTATRSS
jgi:UMF1 family MFS transporter